MGHRSPWGKDAPNMSMALGATSCLHRGDPGLEDGKLKEAHFCLCEGGLCHDGLSQEAMRPMSLGYTGRAPWL